MNPTCRPSASTTRCPPGAGSFAQNGSPSSHEGNEPLTPSRRTKIGVLLFLAGIAPLTAPCNTGRLAERERPRQRERTRLLVDPILHTMRGQRFFREPPKEPLNT